MNTATTMSESEKSFLSHMMRWGSDGYPIQKISGKWYWTEFFGIQGAPCSYKTKKSATQAVEKYIDVLIDKAAT